MIKSKGANRDFKSKFDKGKWKLEHKDLGNKAKLRTPSKKSVLNVKDMDRKKFNVLIEELSLHWLMVVMKRKMNQRITIARMIVVMSLWLKWMDNKQMMMENFFL